VQRNYDAINAKTLRKLGNAVYPDGGDELVQMVQDAKAGKTLEL
jgi:hypothetical protein